MKHAITIRTSPSKPQVVCTPRRRATINPFEKPTLFCSNGSLSIPYPNTPPLTPAFPESVIGLGIDPIIERKYDKTCERSEAKPKWTQTPPKSSSIDTVRRFLLEPTPAIRADILRPTPLDQPPMSERNYWIIMELEASIASTPLVNLQLDSPVIIQICLLIGQRRVPSKRQPNSPLNRYSKFNGPLSSHPTNSLFDFPLQAISSHIPPTTPISTRALRIVSPHASSQYLSSLQATYLALRYVSTIHLISPSSYAPPSSYDETHPALSANMPYIPAKARAMLGLLQTPTTRPGLPASWTQSQSRGWGERIENLECKLRREVLRLIRMCQGSDSDEALVRAIGQIIDFAQEKVLRSS